LQDFFLEWQEDLIKYLRKNYSVIDAWNNLYFVKYEARSTLKVPKDKTERREFFDSVPLCKIRFYKLGKQAIIENMVWYTLLQRDHEKALNRISALYFWITILGFICFAFIFIYFN
jgi:hypothetical protein